MIDQTIVVGPFQCNCRLLACEKTGDALLIDAGDEAPRLLTALKGKKTASGLPLRVRYLLHTHGHLDHIAATREVSQRLEALGDKPVIAIHRADEPLYLQLKMQGDLFGFEYQDPLPVDLYLEEEQEITVGESLKLRVIHTPGHSPGSVCFNLSEDSASGVGETLFTGDTLFQGSIGRTDLWGGDHDQLMSSIRQRIFTLDDDIRVCPGHGPETQVGIEKRQNPFFTNSYR